MDTIHDQTDGYNSRVDRWKNPRVDRWIQFKSRQMDTIQDQTDGYNITLER